MFDKIKTENVKIRHFKDKIVNQNSIKKKITFGTRELKCWYSITYIHFRRSVFFFIDNDLLYLRKKNNSFTLENES